MQAPLHIDPALLAGARALARREGGTVERIIEEGLRWRLAAPAMKPPSGQKAVSQPPAGQPAPSP